MSCVIYVEETALEASTWHMLVTFKSGGDALRFHLPAHLALRFRHAVMKDAWQVCCAPGAEVIEVKPKRTRKHKASSE